MARMPVTIYKKSVLATLVSFFGSVFMFVGVSMLFEYFLGGVLSAIAGFLLLLLGAYISKRKQFKLWAEDLKNKGVLERLPVSRELCLQVYQAYPDKMTIRLIEQYNPTIAEELLAKRKADTRRKT